jgi:chromosome segregation ATPase
MFGKRDLVDSLNRDLANARNKRDTLSAGVTTLTAKIAELEARLAAENERRERERAASKIEGIKKQVTDRSSSFAAAITGIRNTTEVAESIVPEASELNELLGVVATEVAKAINGLLRELDLRMEAVRAGNAAPELPQSLTRSAETPQISAAPSSRMVVSKEAQSAEDQAPWAAALINYLDTLEAVRAGNAAPDLPQSLIRSAETPQISAAPSSRTAA